MDDIVMRLALVSLALMFAACGGEKSAAEDPAHREFDSAVDDALAWLAKQNMNEISKAVQTHIARHGSRPASLDALSAPLEGEQLAREDPWGLPYELVPAAEGNKFRLRSLGPDGKPDTNDDVWVDPAIRLESSALKESLSKIRPPELDWVSVPYLTLCAEIEKLGRCTIRVTEAARARVGREAVSAMLSDASLDVILTAVMTEPYGLDWRIEGGVVVIDVQAAK